MVIKNGENNKNILSGFSWTGMGHGIFMGLTFLLVFFGIFSNMSDFTDDEGILSFKNTRTAQLFGVSIAVIVLWVIFFSVRTYQDVYNTLDKSGLEQTNKIKSGFNKAFLLLAGLSFFSSMIYFLCYL